MIVSTLVLVEACEICRMNLFNRTLMDKQIVKLSTGTRYGNPRSARNSKLADEYRQKGYEVIQHGYPLNAFLAIYKGTNPHNELERTVGEIFAENGLSITLEKDGGTKIRLKDGRMLEMPSLDGIVDNAFSHEIMALKGKPSADKVAEGIKHSFKVWKQDKNQKIQADVAITFTPKGTKYHREHIEAGVKEYKRQVSEGQTEAKPLIYLHVDENHREIYYRNIK